VCSILGTLLTVMMFVCGAFPLRKRKREREKEREKSVWIQKCNGTVRSAMELRERERERAKERARERERAKEKERKKERESVCIYMCV